MTKLCDSSASKTELGARPRRTISSVDLGQRPLSLADEDRDLGIVLLHGGVGAREE